MRRLLFLAALCLLPSLAAAGARRPGLAVLDFECPDGSDLGARIADRVDKRLLQANKHDLYDRDDVRAAVKLAKLQVALKGAEKAIQAFARDRLGADLVVWGRIERLPDERGFRVAVRAMKTQGEPTPYLDVEDTVANFGFFTQFYKKFEPILLEQRTTLRTLTPVSEQARAVDLVPNGSFEQGTWTPGHWTKVDGLTSLWTDRPDGKGKCLKVDTNVLLSQAEPWWKKIRAGQATAKDAPKPIPVKPSQIYATVGGLDGVQIYSDLIPVKPKMRYRLTVDIKANWSGIFFPKAFVKGYADRTDEFTTQKQELYRAYLALRTETKGKEWETFTRTFNPTLDKPQVKYMRVMLYSYWPLGLYYWDNVKIAEEAVED